MPYRVLHFEGAALAAVELYGTVRWPDVAAALRAVYLHPWWIPCAPVLWDASRVTAVDVSPADLDAVRMAFNEVAEAREGGRTAFLVAPGSDDWLWRLLPRLGPPSSRYVEAFTRRQDALSFLGRTSMPEEADAVVGIDDGSAAPLNGWEGVPALHV